MSDLIFQDIVWGAAYEVQDELLDKGSALNVREKTYQERKEETVYTNDGKVLPEKALVFLGNKLGVFGLKPMLVRVKYEWLNY